MKKKKLFIVLRLQQLRTCELIFQVCSCEKDRINQKTRKKEVERYNNSQEEHRVSVSREECKSFLICFQKKTYLGIFC